MTVDAELLIEPLELCLARFSAGRGDPWRVGRMRIVRGEPERGDDRGALVRRRVTQRDEALVEPHLDAGGAADRDGVERAPAGVLAVVQLAQRGPRPSPPGRRR